MTRTKKILASPPLGLMELKVKHIMNSRPRTVKTDTSIKGLIERFRGQIEGCFPVINKKKKLVGIVTESDVLDIFKKPTRHALFGASMIKEARKGAATHVNEIMTGHPIVATPDMSVDELIKLMTAHKLRHLPVVKNNKLVGMVTLRQVMELYQMIER